MTQLTCAQATDYSLADIAELVTRAFERYFVPIAMSETDLVEHIRVDSVDLSASRVVLADGDVAGAALIARRGWTSRVAAMGMVPEWRNKGVGKYLINELLDNARRRGDRQMVLEVIVQNEAAVHVYEAVGFQRVRRLVGLSSPAGAPGKADGLEELDIRELARLIHAHALHELPWQLSAESVAQRTPPFRAYRMDGAYAMISDPASKDVRFYSLLVEPSVRRRGKAQAIIKALQGAHAGRNWHVPAIFPEEIVDSFEKVGFARQSLAQWQMEAAL
jgi:GNAT superfamily N-acetyltransferase